MPLDITKIIRGSQVSHGYAMEQHDEVLQVKICRVVQPFHHRILPSKPATRLDRLAPAMQKIAVAILQVADELIDCDSIVGAKATHATESCRNQRISFIRRCNELSPSFCHFGPPLP